MKRTLTSNWLKAAFLGAALAVSTTVGFGQSGVTNNPNTFDTTDSTKSMVLWWGTCTMTWDSTRDAANNANSGSCQWSAPFTGAASQQFMTWFSIANRWGWDAGTIIDATTYTNFSFDIKVDPSSAITPGGNYGNLECGLVTQYWDPAVTNYVWGTIYLNYGNIPLTATNWTHFNKKIDNTAAHIDRVVGFFIKMWSNGAHTNTLTFNIDNVGIQKPEAPVIIPPPTMALAKPVHGLAFIAASAGQYDRQEIRTVATNYSWIGASGPVSYSIDVAKIGQDNPPGFAAFLHFIPGGGEITRPDSDWHEPNVLMWSIENNATGGAYSTLRYKTNAPESNGHLYDTGTLGGPGSANYKGTWSIAFTGDTSVTMTSPDGSTLTTNLPPEVIDIFKATPGMQVNIGGVPGDLARLGQMAVVTRAHFTGTPATIDSDFLPAAPDPAIWTNIASSAANGVKWIGPSAVYWLNNTLPAQGFSLQAKSTLGAGLWTDPVDNGYEIGGFRFRLLSEADLPGADSGYFRMIKRAASRLLVLLPGETNAPNTLTGKGGPPFTATNNYPFTVTVMSVDDTFHPVAVNGDTIELTSSSTIGEATIVPAQVTLANGVASWPDGVYLYASGLTLTATNVTTPAWQTYTTTPITVVNP